MTMEWAKVSEQNDRLARLEKAVARLGEVASDPEGLFKTVLELFCDAAGAERLSLMLLGNDGHQGELRIVEARGLSGEVISGTRQKLGEGVAGWVAQHGRFLFKNPPAPYQNSARGDRSYKSQSFLSLPLKVGDEVLGVVNMTERSEDRAFSLSEVKAFSVLAGQTAVWIRHCQKLQQATRLSVMDELTSLYNRRYFLGALRREINRARRSGQRLSLAMLDIDHFKTYNDTRGHQAGDRALQQFARVLQDNVRSMDTLCRYGGEEFVIVLPETGEGGGYGGRDNGHFVDRLRAAVSECPFEGEQTQPGGRLTMSAGVALFPEDANSLEALIAVADRRLYEAKRAGRNRVCSRLPLNNPH